MKRWLGAAAVILALSACSGTGTDVDWSNYAPEVRDRIDALAASGDCIELQAEFDTAEANDDAQRSRTGDGNADLMAYIDVMMRDAGCYE